MSPQTQPWGSGQVLRIPAGDAASSWEKPESLVLHAFKIEWSTALLIESHCSLHCLFFWPSTWPRATLVQELLQEDQESHSGVMSVGGKLLRSTSIPEILL